MSYTSSYTCDGCGLSPGPDAKREGWIEVFGINPYRHYCKTCAPRVMEFFENKSMQATEREKSAEATTQAARELVDQTVKKYDALYREHQKCTSAQGEITHLKAAADRITAERNDYMKRLDERDKDARNLAREILGMLGKKARKRYAGRISQIEMFLFPGSMAPFSEAADNEPFED